MKEIRNTLLIFAVAFVVNLIWENSHMPLYDISALNMEPWRICVRATFWDAVIITGVYLLVDTKDRNKRYVLSVILCVAVAIFIEHRAFVEGRWTYMPWMPTVLGIGLSPLIQLPLLAVVTYEISRRITERK